MNTVIGGSLLIFGCVEYAASVNPESAMSRINLMCARLLVAAGASMLVLACVNQSNFTLALALELALAVLVMRQTLVEALVTPVPALLGLLSGFVPDSSAPLGWNLVLALPLALAVVAGAVFLVRRFERARAALLCNEPTVEKFIPRKIAFAAKPRSA